MSAEVYENDNRMIDVHRKPNPQKLEELRKKVEAIKKRLKDEKAKTAK